MAEEQAAAWCGAVARGISQDELFAAVDEEIGWLVGADPTALIRLEPRHGDARGRVERRGRTLCDRPQRPMDDQLRQCGTTGAQCGSGREAPLDGPFSEEARQLAIRSAVGSRVSAAGRGRGGRRLDPLGSHSLGHETRLAQFTELLATGSRTPRRGPTRSSRRGAGRAAAGGDAGRARSSPAEVFAAVAREVAGSSASRRADGPLRADATVTVVASGATRPAFPVGTRVPLGGKNIATRVPTRAAGPDRDYARRPARSGLTRGMGIRSAVGTPILVDGRLWGVMVAASPQAGSLPADTESRLGFTELVATAISNVRGAASWRRPGRGSWRRPTRSAGGWSRSARRRAAAPGPHDHHAEAGPPALQDDDEDRPALLTEALEHAEQATAELRELAHGILPAVLAQGGLRAGVDALASRMPVPVENGVSVGRLPATVEATAYFVVAEALTNVAKHARAGRAEVTARIEDGTLVVHVRDDGVGGARPDGSGLIGLADRLAALDGELRVESPADGGTSSPPRSPSLGSSPSDPLDAPSSTSASSSLQERDKMEVRRRRGARPCARRDGAEHLYKPRGRH